MAIQTIYQYFLTSNGVFIDSREVVPNSIFVAFDGNQVNGNRFVADALNKGAQAVIMDDPEFYPGSHEKADQVFLVDDSLTSLQELATYHRQQLAIPVVAITGSNGKTTTKELAKSVLDQRFLTFATPGNLNNHIGLPLSILAISFSHQVAILEFGANHQGEHERLCQIAQPSHGLITNIGKDHLEGYGGMAGVIQAHKEFTDYLYFNHGIMFINVDDPNVRALGSDTYQVRYGSFDSGYTVDCGAVINNHFPHLTLQVQKSLYDHLPYTLDSQLYGDYNFGNMMVAVCLGEYFKVPVQGIQAGIQLYEPTNNRSQVIEKEDHTIILDAYNANPSSMEVAIQDFSRINAACQIAVLGDMYELGEYSAQEHERIISLTVEKGLEPVFVGSEFARFSEKYPDLTFLASTAEAKDWYQSSDLANCWVLIKGSRGMALENILDTGNQKNPA